MGGGRGLDSEEPETCGRLYKETQHTPTSSAEMPLVLMYARLSTFPPSQNSIVNTRGVVSDQYTSGT